MRPIKDRLEKIAYEYTVEPGVIDAQTAMQRARRRGDTGIDQHLASRELVGDRITKSLAGAGIGGLAGAGAGGLLGLGLGRPGIGAGIGGLSGAALGQAIGQVKADVDYLRSKGIDPKLLGLAGARFTPEAAERYGVKAASLAEYSVLFDKIADGDFGEEARHALLGVCDAVESTEIPEKIASAEDLTYISEDDARKARLDQLLKR